MNYTITLGRDRNGNKVLRYSTPGERGFSVQTNGNLFIAHRMDPSEAPFHQLQLLWNLRDYVWKYGTRRQKNILPLRGTEQPNKEPVRYVERGSK